MKKFETGVTYFTRSTGDHNCIFQFTVIKRTEKTVSLKDKFGEVNRKKISEYNGEEICYPNGKYSMCAVLGANDDKVKLPDWEKPKVKKQASSPLQADDYIKPEYQKMIDDSAPLMASVVDIIMDEYQGKDYEDALPQIIQKAVVRQALLSKAILNNENGMKDLLAEQIYNVARERA